MDDRFMSAAAVPVTFSPSFSPLFGKAVHGVKIVNVRMLLAELIARGIVGES